MVIAKNNAKEGEIQKPRVLNTAECKTIARGRAQLKKKKKHDPLCDIPMTQKSLRVLKKVSYDECSMT